MIIAIPSSGKSIKSTVSNNLGRSNYIITYDTETKKYSSTPNPGADLQDGSGPKTAELVVQSGADTLLSVEVGMKAYSVLAKARIKIELLKFGKTVKDAVENYLNKPG